MLILRERDEIIKKWLKEAANELRASLNTHLDIQKKSRKNDLVTKMDRKVEKDLINNIKKYFPQDKIISEEGYGDNSENINFETDRVWYLDPIDGTLNFVLQKQRFGIMIAVYEKNIGQQAYIYDVMRDELYWSVKGQGVYRNEKLLDRIENQSLTNGLFASNSMFVSNRQVQLNAEITKQAMGVRTIGAASMEAIELLKGNTVAYLGYNLKAWDIAAVYMMIRENGGQVQRLDGLAVDFLQPSPTIIGTAQAISDIQSLI